MRILGSTPLFRRCGSGLVGWRCEGTVLCWVGCAVEVRIEGFRHVHGRDCRWGVHCGLRYHGGYIYASGHLGGRATYQAETWHGLFQRHRFRRFLLHPTHQTQPVTQASPASRRHSLIILRDRALFSLVLGNIAPRINVQHVQQLTRRGCNMPPECPLCELSPLPTVLSSFSLWLLLGNLLSLLSCLCLSPFPYHVSKWILLLFGLVQDPDRCYSFILQHARITFLMFPS